MLRRDFEVFFFGTAMEPIRKAPRPGRKPQLSSENPAFWQPHCPYRVGLTLFPQLGESREWRIGDPVTRLIEAGAGRPRVGIERQRQLLRRRLADIDHAVFEGLH